MEFTHEELFQFYSQVRTNENSLSVNMCVFVCVCVCVCVCVRACVCGTYVVLVCLLVSFAPAGVHSGAAGWTEQLNTLSGRDHM